MQNLVSILIPCYNGEKFVAEAIESALGQTHSNVEVIVVDDGSTDHSVEVLKSFGDRIIFEAASNQGACIARNRAFELSSGEYIQFLDADDLLCPHKIETQLPILVSGEADLTFCKGYIFGDGKPERPKKRIIGDPNGIDPFVYCINQGLSTEGPLIKREFVEKVNGFTPSLLRGQEWNFHLRLAAAGVRIHFQSELLYRHRHDDRAERITRRSLPDNYFTEHAILLGKILDSEAEYNFTQDRRTEFCSMLVSSGLGAFRSGYRNTAKEAINLAFILDPTRTFVVPGSKLYQRLARIFGPLRLETLLAPIRKCKQFITR
ncbi:MAG: glycosyltransferase family A protein [Gimesia sp.]